METVVKAINIVTVLQTMRTNAKNQLKNNVKRAKGKYNELCKVIAAGLLPVADLTEWMIVSCEEIDVKANQLPTIRALFGEIEVRGKYAVDDSDSEIRVVVGCKKLKYVRFAYRAELPADAKCKVVTNTSTYKSLQCAIG